MNTHGPLAGCTEMLRSSLARIVLMRTIHSLGALNEIFNTLARVMWIHIVYLFGALRCVAHSHVLYERCAWSTLETQARACEPFWREIAYCYDVRTVYYM